jgi:hypothetical protein
MRIITHSSSPLGYISGFDFATLALVHGSARHIQPPQFYNLD